MHFSQKLVVFVSNNKAQVITQIWIKDVKKRRKYVFPENSMTSDRQRNQIPRTMKRLTKKGNN